ncbi:MAG: type II toxin-antitoxin system mRNA interferase toxin, RelE/StbE family [Nitrospirales bacterium]|nr:type II toxin-antitoxin system mRNA interferase toxin, RelE/StbE family [Nitrospirales bacterium]
MGFEIQFKASVKKELQKLTKSDQEQILDSLQQRLAQNPYEGKAFSGEFKGLYRWRIGNVRVIYEIHNKQLIVLVLKIARRKDIYR